LNSRVRVVELNHLETPESSRSPMSERARLALPAIVVHGGAGTFERVRTSDDEASLVEELTLALRAGWMAFEAGGSSLDAVVEAVVSFEDSGRFNAGIGGARTVDGELELDAAVMEGVTGHCGGVCATTWPRNPVRAAHALALAGAPGRAPVLLAGSGADLFAAQAGLPRMHSHEGPGGHGTVIRKAPHSPFGTVGAVAVDAAGHLAAATSTGGREGQKRGRVGDTPIIGAGTWADDASVAISATGEGELFVVAGFAHFVDWEMKGGSSLEEAMERGLAQVSYRGGAGGAISIDPAGEMVCTYDTRAMARGWKDSRIERVAILEPPAPE
jgi:beta-aspartyl-peptidase (threonine type)